jgi:hypothetical protein
MQILLLRAATANVSEMNLHTERQDSDVAGNYSISALNVEQLDFVFYLRTPL